MSETRAGSTQGDRLPLRVSHVADAQRRYPGEGMAFYTRVEVCQPLSGFELQVTVPMGLTLDNYVALNDDKDELPVVATDGETTYLTWSRTRGEAFTGRFEYLAGTTVLATDVDCTVQSRAIVTATGNEGMAIRDAETAAVAVIAKGRYLRYLPSIYQQDELMGRFLMLFESFWSPIESQIDNLPSYFDPRMTPPEFLPWLASWINLVLDERWPEQKRRELLRSAARLYRKRGTRQGLEEYLEIYSGQKPHIVEHRAHNFRLGREARLGPSVALGTHNEPHTFTVTLHVPPPVVDNAGSEGGREEQERRWQRQVQAIVDAEKPAHTGYTLEILET